MTSTPREREMLKRVRRWRKEAYEADQARTEKDRRERGKELLDRFGLSTRTQKRSVK